MIEEPYRWVEAISNRREYIEDQLATGSPIACLSCAAGILFLTIGRERQKIFEIYDRIAMGAVGHPGDIERLRMAAIEVASTEGFVRSANDVSLRRLANYSLSPALKTAFEQVYGAPYLARMIFAELGRGSAPNLLMRMEYDGSIHTNGGTLGRSFEDFGVVSGTAHSTGMMEKFLAGKSLAQAPLEEALQIALEAWSVGHIALAPDASDEIPPAETVSGHLKEHLAASAIEAALLDKGAGTPASYRTVSATELDPVLKRLA